MITDCPSCQRQFRINAWQLSSAGGLVQCGFCGKQFNALQRLHDGPLTVTELAGKEASKIEDELVEEPQFEIPASNPGSDNGKKTTKQQFVSTRAGRPDQAAEPVSIQTPLEADTNDEELAQELLEQLDQSRSVWGTVIWTIGALCLLLFIVVQLIWFNRDWLLSHYPQYRPLARQLCEKYGCELTRERDLGAIVLVNRDVRDHPRYSQTLLVNATIENQSDMVQPYPGIRLTLYDMEGKISGYRIFSPPEYLDDTTNIEAGMPAHMPVHLVLEITGAKETAVSFEFHFI